MKKYVVLFLITLNAFSQKDIKKAQAEVVAEGKRLYQSEMASWYGSDLFLENYKEREKIGGYFSYSEGSVSTCVFFSKEESPKVIGTMVFDPTFDVKTAKVIIAERTFSNNENDFYMLRKNALKAMSTDTIFKYFENSNLNLVPIISNGEKKVYVLTGPTKNGVVIYGNDYLLTFDSNNKLKKTKRLHANIIPVNYGDDSQIAIASMHSHLPETGELITATDICTTMLYEKFTGWESVYVMSKKYVSIWNCKTDELDVVTQEAFDKITKEKDWGSSLLNKKGEKQ